jgi:exopolysaccharide biosynthesis polyprenyl glycosylphosphotransferase
VVAVDLAAITVSIVMRQLWGDQPARLELLVVPALAVLALTVFCLGITRAWEPGVIGQGSEEFSRLLRAFVTSAVVLGLVGLALQQPEMRPWVFGVLPIAALLAAIGRLLMRRALHARRVRGECLLTVLAVGAPESVAQLISRTVRAPHEGWLVTAACTPEGAGPGGSSTIAGVPVVGDLDSVPRVVADSCPQVVSVAQAPGWTSRRLHQLAWDIERSGAELVVDPGLMEIAGPRMHIAAVDGMPLLRLTEPTFSGVPRVIKAAVDQIAAILLLLALAPLLLAIAIAVRCDGGPVFFRQTRIGRHGREFQMIKFRSMVADAENRRAELLESNEGSGPLFKMANDPRITATGRWIRKYSLDELPQLFNVLSGSMSLIGPRPPLATEVETYGRDAQRRLLVKPGLTGLWQVSGRSDLSWEESVRLDLRYVENWTLALDALILWKTVGAVIQRKGAY